MTATAPPDPDADLLARLRGGEPMASAELVRAHVDGLVEHLRRCHPTAHEHFLVDAAEDALLGLIKNPHTYDPARCSLAGYLRMSALGDLRNALQKEARHHVGRASADCVEEAPDSRNDQQVEHEGSSFDDPGLAAVIAGFTETERRFFDLMRAGEKRTAVLAVALGVADRPVGEQQDEVKRVRDRLIKRLRRAKEET